jgi:hypothetical protein
MTHAAFLFGDGRTSRREWESVTLTGKSSASGDPEAVYGRMPAI